MYANTFAVQLSSWTNARDTLWFLAMLYSGVTLLYVILIHVQRHPSAAAMNANPLPSITPQEQEEFMKMSPQQQQAFMQEYQQRVAVVQEQQQQQQNPEGGPPQPPGAGCCGSDSGLEFYDTPLYEFVRMAWFVSGLTAFVWTCNLFVSFWAFSSFYISNTSGPLRAFWTNYASKMNASLIVVTVFLAWPLCCFVLEVVVWLIGVLPWFAIRSTCKRGVEMYRPALPLSQLPMYIRADMFFMDFQDVKRLGFSRQAWMILTGSDRPFFDGSDDPTVDKDPAMTQLMHLRMQWQQTMLAMMPPWMQQGGAGMMLGPNGQMLNYQQQQQQMMLMMSGQSGQAPPSQGGTPATIATNGAVLPTHSPAATPAEYPIEESGDKTHRRRRRSTHERHRHADPAAASNQASASGVDPSALGPSNGGGAANASRPRRRHRSKSRSRSKAVFEGGAAPPAPPGTDAAVAGSTPAGPTTRHRRRHSRSKERGPSGGASPTPAVPPAPSAAAAATGGEDQEGGHHRRHSRSRSRSKAAGDASVAAAAAATSGAGGAPDTQHRHRRRSHSRSREKPAKKGPAAADLDALMQL